MSRWSKKETNTLLQGASIYGQEWFVRRTGRSLAAIRARARRLYGPGGLSRGSMSLREASRRTGYHETQLRRAQAACRQKWKRTSARGRYLIHEEQLEELVDWLVGDYWCATHRLYGCAWCSTVTRSHYALGLCARCYARYHQAIRRRGWPRQIEELAAFADSVVPEDHRLLRVWRRVCRDLSRGRVPDKDDFREWAAWMGPGHAGRAE